MLQNPSETEPSPTLRPRQSAPVLRGKSTPKQNPTTPSQPRGKSASNWRPLPTCPKAPTDPNNKGQAQRPFAPRSNGARPQSIIGLRAAQAPQSQQKAQPSSPTPKGQPHTNPTRSAATPSNVDQSSQVNMTSSPQLQRSAPAGPASSGHTRAGSASFGTSSPLNGMTSSNASSNTSSSGEGTSTPWGPMIPGCQWKKKIVPWNPSSPQRERRISVASQRQKGQNGSVSPALTRSQPVQQTQTSVSSPSSPTPAARSANAGVVNNVSNALNTNVNAYNTTENANFNANYNTNFNAYPQQQQENGYAQQYQENGYNQQYQDNGYAQQDNGYAQPTTETAVTTEQQQQQPTTEEVTVEPSEPITTTEGTVDNANESSKSVSPTPDSLGASSVSSSSSSGSGASKKPHSKKEEAELERAHAYLDKIRQINPSFFEKAEDVEVKSIGNCALWVPDSASDKCMMCGKPFGTLTRRHHCRQCGRLLCGDCTSWKMDTSRACPECFCSFVESGGAQTLFAGGGGSSRLLIQEDEAAMDREEEERAAAAAAEEEEKKRKAEEAAALLPEDKEERLRYKCVQEIITTEKTYAEQLNTLINVYLFPIKMTGILNQEQVNGIFSNVETIEPVHQELIKNLTDDDYTKGGEYIGEAFKKMCQYLKMYTIYCANHDHAIEMIESLKSNAEFQKTLSICQTDYRTKGENLGSFIIKPVQRICKYPLLFRELISHTPETHPDYNLLIETKAKIDDVVKAINEGKRRMEQQQKMVEILNSVDGTFEGEGLITPSRVWIADYKVKGKSLLGSSKMIDYTLYLFNDLLMITRSASSGKKQPLKAFIPIMDAVFTVISDTEKEKNCFEVSYKNHKSTFKFFLDSEARRDTITKELKATQKEFQKKVFSGQFIKSGEK